MAKFPALIPILCSLSVVAAPLRGSPQERKSFQQKFRGLTTSNGTASIWFTLNLYDVNSPELVLFTGTKPCRINLPRRERWKLIAKDGFAAAKWFHTFCELFIGHLLCFSKGISYQRGIFGTVVTHGGPKETNGRGSLHYHTKITTHELQHIRTLLKEPALHSIVKKFATGFVNSIISSSSFAIREIGDKSSLVIGEDTERIPLQIRDLNGVLYEGNLLRSFPHQANSSAPAFGKSFRERVTEKLQASVTDEYTNLLARMGALTQLTNKHGHRQCADGKFIRRACHAPCWKTPKHKARGLCRGEYHETGKQHAKETFITDDGDIITERNDGHVVSFSPTSLLLFGCNNNTALISTGMQGSAVDYYMTDYGTKTELTTTQIFTILAGSDTKVPDMSSLKGAKSRTVRYVNMLMRSIEQPLQFVATSLLNLPRELISHDSFSIYTSAFNRLITRETNDTKNTNFCQIKKTVKHTP